MVFVIKNRCFHLFNLLLLVLLTQSWSDTSKSEDLSSKSATVFSIGPYLQMPSPSSMKIIWETLDRSSSYLIWWKMGDKQKNKIYPQSEPFSPHLAPSHQKVHLHTVHLQGLLPQTRYAYKILSEKAFSKIHSFITPPLPSMQKDFSFLVMSDGQSGNKISSQNIRRSVMKTSFSTEKKWPAFALYAGDLVQDGDKYYKWKIEFFDPLSPLIARIPVFPALGNHERNHDLYFTYFDLPKNGDPHFPEHWYYFDYANLRVVTLDTNRPFRNTRQLQWLKKVLEEAEKTKNIDFVVAQFHHPYHSELWPEGNTEYVGEIIQQLEEFALRSKKPTVHFSGHSHGYSRGHSLRANYTFFSVASLGGELDKWGDHFQQDYLEFVKSDPHFGHLLVQVEGPNMYIKRYKFNPSSIYSAKAAVPENEIYEQITLKRHNLLPMPPVIDSFVVKILESNLWQVFFKTSVFRDIDGDQHFSTQLQLSQNADFSTLLGEKIVHKENWYKGRNLNADFNLCALNLVAEIPIYSPLVEKKTQQTLYGRVRYRDSALGISAWSEVVSLSIPQ